MSLLLRSGLVLMCLYLDFRKDSDQSAQETGVEGNRTELPNSFDGNRFGDESELMRAQTYAFEADSDSMVSHRQQALDDLQRAWKSLRSHPHFHDFAAMAFTS